MPSPVSASGELSVASSRQIARLAAHPEAGRWVVEEVQPHEPALRGYLHRQFPSLDADDVVQESYLKLLKLPEVGQIDSVKSYFFSVALNTARTLFRRRRIYSEVPVNELPESLVLYEGADAVDNAHAHDELKLAASAIDQLPSRCREIVKLAMLHGLTNSEIARRLGLADATVRVQLGRGMKKCADYLYARGECR